MNVNRNNSGSFYRNRSIAGTGTGSSLISAAVSDLNHHQQQQQQRLLLGCPGGPSLFSVSDRIAALAAGSPPKQPTVSAADGGAAVAAAAALSSLGKIGGGGGGVHVGILKDALQSDGRFTKPTIDLQAQPKKAPETSAAAAATPDVAAIAAIFKSIAKPPPLVPTVTETFGGTAASEKETEEVAGVHLNDVKRQQRLEQNKMSARRSRRRKKIILEELQTTVDQLTAENEQLEEENKQLELELERRKKAAVEGDATSTTSSRPTKGQGTAARATGAAASTSRPSDARNNTSGANANKPSVAAAAAQQPSGAQPLASSTLVPSASLGRDITTGIGMPPALRGVNIPPCAVPASRPTSSNPANRSLLISQLATIMSGQAVPGLHLNGGLHHQRPPVVGAATVTTRPMPASLTAASIISSIATPAPRPSQLYLSRPTTNAAIHSSTSGDAQEQLHRSILSVYQEQERKNANKKRRLEK